MTKTSTQTTPGAQRAASPRRSAPEPILKQCLGNGRADTGQGGKDGAQAGVEVQFTTRQCVPTALDGFRVVQGRPRSPTPVPRADSSARIESGARRSRCSRRDRQHRQPRPGHHSSWRRNTTPTPSLRAHDATPCFCWKFTVKSKNFVVKMGNLQSAAFKQNR